MGTQRLQPSISVALLYHRLGPPRLRSRMAGQYVAGSVLRSALEYLIGRGWHAVTLEELVNRCRAGSPSADNEFCVTFDDGYLSVYSRGFPMLAERGIRATVYVVAGSMDGTNTWDVEAGDLREPMMSAAQVRELAECGFEVGSHTMTHAHLTRLSREKLLAELRDSKHRIEDVTGRRVISLAYPYGECTSEIREAAREAGYEYAAGTKLGTVSPKSDFFEIPRVNARWNAIGSVLMQKIRRAHRISEESR